ncbi:hypothetical protein Tco_0638089 [Tanacetum coccineum]
MSGSQDEIPPPPLPPSSSQTLTQQTPHTVSTIKPPILKKGEYDIWAIDRYGYIINHKKIVKNGQARTRERKSAQKPEAKPRKSQPSVKISQTMVKQSQLLKDKITI